MDVADDSLAVVREFGLYGCGIVANQFVHALGLCQIVCSILVDDSLQQLLNLVSVRQEFVCILVVDRGEVVTDVFAARFVHSFQTVEHLHE